MRSEPMQDEPDMEFHCITCSDEALPATVLSIDQATGMALVLVKNEQVDVDISLVDETVPGDTLLVHGGVALARLGADNESG